VKKLINKDKHENSLSNMTQQINLYSTSGKKFFNAGNHYNNTGKINIVSGGGLPSNNNNNLMINGSAQHNMYLP
jgi:hypothetical protein